MRFNSKTGAELLVPIIIVMISTSIIMLLAKAWVGLIINTGVIIFITHMFMTTYYVIEKNKLHINCGFLYRKTIDLNSIKKIRSTNNPISAPALSLKRMEIIYNQNESVIISPKNMNTFVDQIMKVNDSIEVTLKDKRNTK